MATRKNKKANAVRTDFEATSWNGSTLGRYISLMAEQDNKQETPPPYSPKAQRKEFPLQESDFYPQ